MIGTFLTMGLGAVALGGAFANSGADQQAKKEAIQKGERYYFDHCHKQRSTETNEIVMHSFCDNRYKGHDLLIGCETGRIYYDYTAAKIEEANRQLKAEGKLWYWKEFDRRYCETVNSKTPWKAIYMPYDPVAGMPFSLKLNPMRFYEKDNNARYIKEYYDVTGPYKRLAKSEKMSEEQAKPWQHGCSYGCF